MAYKEWLSAIAILLTFIGFFPYIVSIRKGRTKPHVFSWIIWGNFVYSLSRWGMIAVLAQLGGPEMVGRVVLAFAICAPITALGNLGLRSVLVTDARGEYRFGDYFALRLVTSAAAWLVESRASVAESSSASSSEISGSPSPSPNPSSLAARAAKAVSSFCRTS